VLSWSCTTGNRRFRLCLPGLCCRPHKSFSELQEITCHFCSGWHFVANLLCEGSLRSGATATAKPCAKSSAASQQGSSHWLEPFQEQKQLCDAQTGFRALCAECFTGLIGPVSTKHTAALSEPKSINAGTVNFFQASRATVSHDWL
jgi:hypothetical protein